MGKKQTSYTPDICTTIEKQTEENKLEEQAQSHLLIILELVWDKETRNYSILVRKSSNCFIFSYEVYDRRGITTLLSVHLI